MQPVSALTATVLELQTQARHYAQGTAQEWHGLAAAAKGLIRIANHAACDLTRRPAPREPAPVEIDDRCKCDGAHAASDFDEEQRCEP